MHTNVIQHMYSQRTQAVSRTLSLSLRLSLSVVMQLRSVVASSRSASTRFRMLWVVTLLLGPCEAFDIMTSRRRAAISSWACRGRQGTSDFEATLFSEILVIYCWVLSFWVRKIYQKSVKKIKSFQN